MPPFGAMPTSTSTLRRTAPAEAIALVSAPRHRPPLGSRPSKRAAQAPAPRPACLSARAGPRLHHGLRVRTGEDIPMCRWRRRDSTAEHPARYNPAVSSRRPCRHEPLEPLFPWLLFPKSGSSCRAPPSFPASARECGPEALPRVCAAGGRASKPCSQAEPGTQTVQVGQDRARTRIHNSGSACGVALSAACCMQRAKRGVKAEVQDQSPRSACRRPGR